MERNKPEQILDIEYRDYYGNPRKAYLVLRGKITVICGDSGAGKTYLIEMLSDIINSDLLGNTIKLNIDTNRIVTITENYDKTTSHDEIDTMLLNKLKQYRDKIIFIDEADSRLENSSDLRKFIEMDIRNIYVLVHKTANLLNLGITPANIAKAIIKDNTLELVYNYDVGGW